MDIAANLFLIAAAVCLLGAAGLSLLWQRMTAKATASARWPIAGGAVTHAALDSRSDSDGDTNYAAVVRYGYRVGGRAYSSDRLGWGGRDYVTQEKAAATLARYPVGQPVQVHYDPQDPASAVLEPAARGGMLWAPMLAGTCVLIALVFIAAHFGE